MWFQAAECNAANIASLLLNLINNNFPIFLSRIFPFWIPAYSKNPKICDPVLVNLLKIRPHYSHSSHAIPSSGTFLFASCKGVPPPPGLIAKHWALWILLFRIINLLFVKELSSLKYEVLKWSSSVPSYSLIQLRKGLISLLYRY